MRLDVDLGFDAVPGRPLGPGDAATLDLHQLAGALRTPRTLGRILRARSYDELRVREGPLPLSTVQAAALVSLLAVPTGRVVVDDRRMGRTSFAGHALARAAAAVPSETVHSMRLARRVVRSGRRGYHLPRSTATPTRAVYLRVDPTLKWLGAQVGGAATHTSGVINGLIDNGVAVHVLAPERPLATERASFTEVPVRRILQLIRGLTYTDYGEALLIAADHPSCDFVYQRYQLGSDAGLELASRLGVPLVLEFNGSEIWVERHWGSGNLRLAGPLEQLERRNLHDASLVVVVSEPLRQYVLAQGVPPDRVLVNPNGVDVDALATYRVGTPADWRARLGLQEAPTIGFIGTFGLWHGVRLLPALIDAVADARWILVGDGGLMAEVRGEIARRGGLERTLLTGVVDHARALELLACCDVCVSPHVPNPDGTPFFGSPTKLFEYMGLRKPIVASDLDQIGEVIVTERSGLLVPPGDVDAAAAAIRRLLADERLRERLATRAFERATAHYSWTAHASRILAALRAGSVTSERESIVSLTP
jgi:glycosyltransferase involved in cell wall biosynthesis